MRFVVAGGVAVVLHGVPRTTFDLDLLVDLQSDNILAFIGVMHDLGLRPGAPGDPLCLADPRAREEWIREKNLTAFSFADPRGGAVDVLLDVPVDYAAAAVDADIVTLGESRIRVASIASLIRMKEAAGREQDHSDIAALRLVQTLKDSSETDGA